MKRLVQRIPWCSIEQLPLLFYLLRWSFLALIVGLLVGSASASLLVALDWATQYREQYSWLVYLLPLAGLVIGLLYHYRSKGAERGNNFILEEVHQPHQRIPLRMAPLVWIGTVLTHLVGGSAGREGTAVQMGGALSEQVAQCFGVRSRDRRLLLIMGVSGGFASVFGTPLAGAIFGLEVLIIGRMRYEAILPSFLAAAVSHWVCQDMWGVAHTSYTIGWIPSLSLPNMGWVLLVGILFGCVAMLFSRSLQGWAQAFKRLIPYAPFRPVVGGALLVGMYLLLGTTKYMGLGIPTLVESFTVQQGGEVFLLKLLLTTFTLGVGFKGGEVTPLFFVGATLGSALSGWIPLPMGLLAGMGFVAVFAGATHTPIACTLMGIELFGAEAAIYLGLACVVAYLFSGHTGIYTSQLIGSPKHLLYGRLKRQRLRNLFEK